MSRKEASNPYVKDFGRASAQMMRQIARITPPEIKQAAVQIYTDVVRRSPPPMQQEVFNVALNPEDSLEDKLADLRLVRHKLPRTVAIIPDGNRREAKKLNLSVEEGHDLGARILYENLKVFDEFTEVENIVLWAWSEDNEVKRPQEKAGILGTMARYLDKFTPELHERGARIELVGRNDRLLVDPNNGEQELKEGRDFMEQIEKSRELTKKNKGPRIILAVDYGEVHEDWLFGRVKDESSFAEWTHEAARQVRDDSRGIPVPDLLIRTSGEKRLSGFPYGNQAELQFIDVNLPELKPGMIVDALKFYTERERRGGK